MVDAIKTSCRRAAATVCAAPLLAPWAPKRLPPPSRRQRSSSFPRAISVENRQFSAPPWGKFQFQFQGEFQFQFHPNSKGNPLKGFPWNWVSAKGSEETRMMGLPDGRKSFKIGFTRFDAIPACDGQTPASHVAVAYTALTALRG